MRGDPSSAPPPAAAEQSDPRPVASPTEPEKPLQPVDAIEGEGSSLDAAESKQESAGPSASGGQGERKVATSAHQTNGTASDAALIRLPMLRSEEHTSELQSLMRTSYA